MLDLNDYYSGGYFLIRAGNPGWPQLKHELLPEKLISLSRCICRHHLAIYWGWHPGDKQAALEFGISEAQWNEFQEWCNQVQPWEVDYASMFYSSDAARRFVTRFISDLSNLFIIGVGLHRDLEAPHWIKENDEELCGVEKRIAQHLPLESAGAMLGFEVVNFACNDFGDSWLCSGLERDMHELFGIRPNKYGLISTYEEAKKVHDWIAEDNMQGTRAEPEPYDAWLLVSYPLLR